MSNEFETMEQIEKTITALVDQIEWLSKRCKMIDLNQRATDSNSNKHVEWALEASTLMLQLSRSVNELLVTKSTINRDQTSKDHFDKVHDVILGKGQK